MFLNTLSAFIKLSEEKRSDVPSDAMINISSIHTVINDVD